MLTIDQYFINNTSISIAYNFCKPAVSLPRARTLVTSAWSSSLNLGGDNHGSNRPSLLVGSTQVARENPGDLVRGVVRSRHSVRRRPERDQARRLPAGILVRAPGSIYIFIALIFTTPRPWTRLTASSTSTNKRSRHGSSNNDLPGGRRLVCAVHRDCNLGARRRYQRILRRWRWRPPHHQWHGNRCRLDVGGIFHLDGRPDRQHGLRRRPLPDGLDRRLRSAFRLSARTVPAQVRQIHGTAVHR